MSSPPSRPSNSEPGPRFFRGLLFGLPLALVLWVLLIGGSCLIIRTLAG